MEKEINRGPMWVVYTSNPGEIDPEVAKKAWRDAFSEYMQEIEDRGEDFYSNPQLPPSEIMSRKCDI